MEYVRKRWVIKKGKYYQNKEQRKKGMEKIVLSSTLSVNFRQIPKKNSAAEDEIRPSLQNKNYSYCTFKLAQTDKEKRLFFKTDNW
jgi:hypothetical protein